MEQIKISLISSEKENENTVKTFKAYFEELLCKSNCMLNQYVSNNTVEVENNEIGDILNNVMENIISVVRCTEWERFMDQFNTWPEYKNMDVFLRWLNHYVLERLQIYNELESIRQLEIKDLQEKVEKCYAMYYALDGDDEANIDNSDKVVRRIFATLLSMVMSNHYNHKQAWIHSKECFFWEQSAFECFWNVIVAHYDEFWRWSVMEKIRDIEERVNQLGIFIEDITSDGINENE